MYKKIKTNIAIYQTVVKAIKKFLKETKKTIKKSTLWLDWPDCSQFESSNDKGLLIFVYLLKL